MENLYTAQEIYEWLKLSIDESGNRYFTNYDATVLAEYEILRRIPCSCGCPSEHTFDDFVEYYLALKKNLVLPSEPAENPDEDGLNYTYWRNLIKEQTGEYPSF